MQEAASKVEELILIADIPQKVKNKNKQNKCVYNSVQEGGHKK